MENNTIESIVIPVSTKEVDIKNEAAELITSM